MLVKYIASNLRSGTVYYILISGIGVTTKVMLTLLIRLTPGGQLEIRTQFRHFVFFQKSGSNKVSKCKLLAFLGNRFLKKLYLVVPSIFKYLFLVRHCDRNICIQVKKTEHGK